MESNDLKPLYVGNLDPYVRKRDIEKLFEKFGMVDKVDLKSGFAFVFLLSGAEEAIKQLHGMDFEKRRLRVEFARGDGLIKRREDDRRRQAQTEPSNTLFVVNFDPVQTRKRDIEKHFEQFGRLVRVEVKRNFAFVEFETIEEATEAMKSLNGKQLIDREITVEYMASRHSLSSERRSRSPPTTKRRRSRGRSPSPRRYAPYPYPYPSSYHYPPAYYDQRPPSSHYDHRYMARPYDYGRYPYDEYYRSRSASPPRRYKR